ncbi:YceD family protein [Spiribacter halobius]|nr:YceD family protein [Spiribacter halobius]UEX76693.1 YceD family protein [Spiribacter halobius]
MREGVLPEWLDLRRLGAAGARLAGPVELAGLSRLRERLQTPAGEAEAEVRVAFDQGLKAVVSGHVRASVVMRCERCLGAVTVPVAGDFTLAVIEDEGAAEGLPAEEEPVLAPGGRLAVHALVEDELLLALPIVAFHDDSACDGGQRYFAPEGEAPPERESPFAALAELKRGRS